MQIKLDALDAHLAKGLKGLYVVYGDEHLLAQEACDRIRAAARSGGFTDRSVFTVERYFDWSSLLGASQSMSLFGDRQLVELRIPTGKPGKEGAEALKTIASADNPDVLTLITLPRLDSATQKAAWFTAITGTGVALKIDPVERAQLPMWVNQRLSQQGQRVAPGEEGRRALTFIAERVEGNLLAAHQEIQKLALLHPAGELSWEQVEGAVNNVARYDVFKLSEAVLAGNPQRVARMLDGLQAEGEAEVLVHYTIAEDIRALKRVKDAMASGRPLPMALRENRIWGPRERAFERVLPRLDDRMLTRLLRAAHVVDGVVKGLKQPDWPASGWQARAPSTRAGTSARWRASSRAPAAPVR
jgi:DNA polymerase-3 subunit delta